MFTKCCDITNISSHNVTLVHIMHPFKSMAGRSHDLITVIRQLLG